MEQAGKATDPKFRDSRVAEVRITGPDYRGFIEKSNPVFHFKEIIRKNKEKRIEK
jgi:hypothetical protein